MKNSAYHVHLLTNIHLGPFQDMPQLLSHFRLVHRRIDNVVQVVIVWYEVGVDPRFLSFY